MKFSTDAPLSTLPLTRAIDTWAGSVSHSQQTWLNAQHDACRRWLVAPRKEAISTLIEHQVDCSIDTSSQLVTAQVQAHNAWLHWTERWLCQASRALGVQLKALPPSATLDAWQSALSVSGCAVGSLSKASRQVNEFASSCLSAATRRALSSAQEELRRPR